MFKNGRPYTNENGSTDDKLITSYNEQEIALVFKWIKENILPRKTPLKTCSSYGLKEYLKDDTGINLSNNEFKDAMLLSGFSPIDPNEINWHYCISKRSLVFDRFHDKKLNSVTVSTVKNNNGIIGNIVNSSVNFNSNADNIKNALNNVCNLMDDGQLIKVLSYADKLLHSK